MWNNWWAGWLYCDQTSIFFFNAVDPAVYAIYKCYLLYNQSQPISLLLLFSFSIPLATCFIVQLTIIRPLQRHLQLNNTVLLGSHAPNIKNVWLISLISEISYTFLALGAWDSSLACWPLVLKFAGSNPAEAFGFFSGEKFLSVPSFGREVKLCAPCLRFAAC
jgi:hypothetical protein